MYIDIIYYCDHLVSQPPNVYIYVLNLEPFYARTVLCQVRYLDLCELKSSIVEFLFVLVPQGG